MNIELSGQYNRMYRTLIAKNPDVAEITFQRVLLFRRNSQDTRLHTHALRKRLEGKYAFSVTDDIRIVFIWLGKTIVRFLAIGSHTEVYGPAGGH